MASSTELKSIRIISQNEEVEQNFVWLIKTLILTQNSHFMVESMRKCD